VGIVPPVTTVSLTVCGDDPSEVDRLARGLHGELRGLDADIGLAGPGEPPPGSKGVDPDVVTTIIATLSGSRVLLELAGTLRDWVNRANGRKIVLRDGERSIEVTASTLADSSKAIEAFLRTTNDR
jgi:membrane-associated two-gene conflict system component 1 (EACC1)